MRLQDAVAAERLVDELALIADLLDEDARGFPDAPCVERVGQQREGQDAHREQRELRMPEEQHGDEADDGDGLADDGDPRIAERVLDAVRGLKLRHERAGARAGEKLEPSVSTCRNIRTRRSITTRIETQFMR